MERLVSQISVVGGVPEGEWRGRTPGFRSDGTLGAYDPEEIFHMLPVSIDFQKLPKRPETRRFVQFYAQFDTNDYSSEQELRKSGINTYTEFLRFGFPRDPEQYSTADRSHLSIVSF
ncbi:hypothetical protein J4232_05425 [Candidatus Woesearchaeota archaeon]|nr:hypothetical protein [Candidatus Woesearchaeota archaeon]